MLNENHIKQMINEVAQNKLKTESIYDLSKNLTDYFLSKIQDKPLKDIEYQTKKIYVDFHGCCYFSILWR